MIYETSQSYMLPNTSECSNAPCLGQYLITYLWGMEGWVDLGCWLCTDMVYWSANRYLL